MKTDYTSEPAYQPSSEQPRSTACFSATKPQPRERIPKFLLVGNLHGRPFTYRFEQRAVLIGRARDNDLCLVDRYASAHHCMLLYFEGQFFLRERNSRNGTRVAGRWVHGEVPLAVGQEIHIGETILRLQLEHDAGGRESPFPLGPIQMAMGATPPHGHRPPPFMHPLDDLTFEPTPIPCQSSTSGAVNSPQIQPPKTPSRASLRLLIEHVIIHAPQLRALLVDYFPDLARQIPPDMERLSVVSILLERESTLNVLRCLQLAFPQECAEHWSLLRWD